MKCGNKIKTSPEEEKKWKARAKKAADKKKAANKSKDEGEKGQRDDNRVQ